MRKDFSVRFEKTAHVSGRGVSWAVYYWSDSAQNWYCKDGNSSEGFFPSNPEFSHTMSDEKMTMYSLK